MMRKKINHIPSKWFIHQTKQTVFFHSIPSYQTLSYGLGFLKEQSHTKSKLYLWTPSIDVSCNFGPLLIWGYRNVLVPVSRKRLYFRDQICKSKNSHFTWNKDQNWKKKITLKQKMSWKNVTYTYLNLKGITRDH